MKTQNHFLLNLFIGLFIFLSCLVYKAQATDYTDNFPDDLRTSDNQEEMRNTMIHLPFLDSIPFDVRIAVTSTILADTESAAEFTKLLNEFLMNKINPIEFDQLDDKSQQNRLLELGKLLSIIKHALLVKNAGQYPRTMVKNMAQVSINFFVALLRNLEKTKNHNLYIGVIYDNSILARILQFVIHRDRETLEAIPDLAVTLEGEKLQFTQALIYLSDKYKSQRTYPFQEFSYSLNFEDTTDATMKIFSEKILLFGGYNALAPELKYLVKPEARMHTFRK